MRGEKNNHGFTRVQRKGSPPHARGKGCKMSAIKEAAGITPACAGKSAQSPVVAACALGSPPHARGKGSVSPRGKRSLGITPACAGKSWYLYRAHPPIQDHPRMRGEKQSAWLRSIQAEGSPPHARGKALLRGLRQDVQGITPACAGKRGNVGISRS